MASLKTSGFQRFVEKVLEKFVSREEIINLIQVVSGTTGGLNVVSDGLFVNDQSLINKLGKAKYIEFFDSNGLLAISATIDNMGTIKNICTRCGRIVELKDVVGVIEVNVTTPLGAPAYFKVYAYD